MKSEWVGYKCRMKDGWEVGGKGGCDSDPHHESCEEFEVGYSCICCEVGWARM